MANTNNWFTNGKTVLITGASGGIGKATVIELARLGASRICLACRSVDKGEEAVREIRQNLDGSSDVILEVRQCDLSSLQSIRNFANDFIENYNELHILINNAGIFAPSAKTLSKDGYEITFATNHLGHFYLTTLLLDLLKKSAPSRIVTVSSNWPAFWMCKPGFHIDDPNFDKNPKSYSNSKAYNHSKLANVLFTRELHRKLQESGNTNVTAFSVHPGTVASDIARDLNVVVRTIFNFFGASPQKGCKCSCYCASQPDIEDKSSSYFM